MIMQTNVTSQFRTFAGFRQGRERTDQRIGVEARDGKLGRSLDRNRS